MQKKIKNIVVTCAFVIFLALFAGLCVTRYFRPAEISESERRPLAQFPENITWAGIIDKTVINGFEDYSVDQFPFREWFRALKANFQLKVLCLNENNGLAVKNDYIAKVEQDFTPELLEYSIGRLQYVYEKFLKENGGNKYVALIPDKNYFFAKDYGYPSPDYEKLAEQVKNALNGMEYIDLFGELELTDYYRTDTHWSQDKIGAVADKLAQAMGAADRINSEYTENTLYPFKGVYYGQSALLPKPDTIVYLTNEILDSCTVYDYETGQTGKIYDFEKFEGNDGYDFFLSGTKALLRIDNPNATTDKELVIFRDSFGSSLSPLLVEGYKSVYLVDIRYVVPDLLDRFIDFENKDVLFLYSALILNSKSFK
ncbi:MAG: DHHW family protein [Lachnospiraceae bacterium]|nr:DHHW family protein [Lachnospiraceae bacterium]